jgi:hypothetical protein
MKHLMIFIATLGLFGCSSLRLEPADFSWPVESVLKADNAGMVVETRYAVSFSVTQLTMKEFADTASAAGITVRVIRDRAGFYYITAPKFKNVYVFTAGDGAMKLSRKIEIGETAMADPKFNQRDSYIELINDAAKLALTKDGIKEGDKK